MDVRIILPYFLISMEIFVSALNWIPKQKLNGRRKMGPSSPGIPVTVHPYFTSVQFYFFEGVDYDFTNEEYLKEHNDCNGEFLRCTRSRVTLPPACAFDTYGYYLEDFDNICQIELYNCRYRVKEKNENVFGLNIDSNRFFFNGKAIDCQVYNTRRRDEAIKLYLGDDYEHVMAIRNEMLRRRVFKEPVTASVRLESGKLKDKSLIKNLGNNR